MPRTSPHVNDPFLPVFKVPLFTEGGNKSAGYSVILDPKGKNLEVGVVSDSYQLIPNKAVHDTALDVLKRTGMEYQDDHMIFDGKRYRQSWVLPNLAVEPVVGDIIQLALSVVNSYDASSRFGISFFARRLICENGCMVDCILGGMVFRHYGNGGFDKELESASESVIKLADKLEPLKGKLQHLIDTPINRESIQAAFKVLKLPQGLVAQVFMKIEEDTLYGLYNSFTSVLTEQNSFHADLINRLVSRFLLMGRL